MTPPTQLTPWYRQFWPWLLISIPAITVVAGIGTIWIASVEPVALVHDDYYKEGLAVNRDLAKDRVASELNLSAEIDIDMQSSPARVEVRLQGDAIPAQLALAFIHPQAIDRDSIVMLDRHSGGGYLGPAPVAAERWYLELSGGESPAAWRLKGEIDLRKHHRIELLPSRN